MALVSLKHVDVCRSGEELVRGLDLAVRPRERVVVLGAERQVTALFDLLEGQIEAGAGEVTREPGLRIGRLSRVPAVDEHATLLAAAASARAELGELRRRIERLREDHEAGNPRAEASLQELEARFEREGGEDMDRRAVVALEAVGFDQAQFEQSPALLSLGERSRLALARLLVQAPDLLLLEDPTRHLDIPGRERLERYLDGYEGGVVVSSCDRAFFDRFATSLLELAPDGAAATFPGSSAEHRARRAERGDPGAVPARGFRFPEMEHSAKVLLTARGLALRPGGQTLLEPVDFQIARGDKIGLVGLSDSGASELLAVLAGKRAPDAGKVHPGFRLLVGYLGPEGAGPATGRTVLAQLGALRPDLSPEELREQAALFLFPGAQAERRVEELHEAESMRLCLMLLVLGPYNTLLLDEPTARLDLRSREVLEEALAAYPGTLVAFSHDRAFLDRVATRVLSFEGRALGDARGRFSELRRAGRVLADHPASPDVSRLARGRRRQAGQGEEAGRAVGGADARGRRAALEGQAAALLARVQELVERMTDPAMALDWEGLEQLSREKKAAEREREACLQELAALKAGAATE